MNLFYGTSLRKKNIRLNFKNKQNAITMIEDEFNKIQRSKSVINLLIMMIRRCTGTGKERNLRIVIIKVGLSEQMPSLSQRVHFELRKLGISLIAYDYLPHSIWTAIALPSEEDTNLFRLLTDFNIVGTFSLLEAKIFLNNDYGWR